MMNECFIKNKKDTFDNENQIFKTYDLQNQIKDNQQLTYELQDLIKEESSISCSIEL